MARARRRSNQVIASIRSLDMSPGTSVIGMGRVPDCRVSAVTSGPGPLLSVPAPSTSTPISGSLAQMGKDFGHRLTFADHQFGLHLLLVAHPFGEDLEMRLDPLARFLPHDLAHADPVIELVGRNDRQDGDAASGMGGTHGGKAHRVEAFAAVIQHDEELAHLALPDPRRYWRKPARPATGPNVRPSRTLPSPNTTRAPAGSPGRSGSCGRRRP